MPTAGSVLDAIRDHAIAGTVARFLEPTPGQALPAFDDDVWNNRTVHADELVELLTTSAFERHRKGVSIIGLRVEGNLDLDEARLDRYVRLGHCQFGPHGIILADADTRGIGLPGSCCGAITADGATITGGLFLTEGFTATGEVRLLGAQINGQLACHGATLINPDGNALSADRATITGSVFLSDGFTGSTRLSGECGFGCGAGRAGGAR